MQENKILTTTVKDKRPKINSMHEFSCNNWIKTRHIKSARKKYLYKPNELKEQEDLIETFNYFDTNGTGSIPYNELYNMFINNGLEIDKQELTSYLQLINTDNNLSLDLEDFRLGVQDVEKSTLFMKMMRKIRRKHYAETKEQNKEEEKKKKQLEELIRENQYMREAFNQQNTDKNINKSFNNFADQDNKNILVIPFSFDNTIKYFSYKLRRQSQMDRFDRETELSKKFDSIRGLFDINSNYCQTSLQKMQQILKQKKNFDQKIISQDVYRRRCSLKL